MGRFLLLAGAALLFVTALIHASGQSMVNGWTAGLDRFESAAIGLVWLTDSWDWTVVSAVWALAAWKGGRGWLGAAAVLCLLPLGMIAGILSIEPTFFGAWMLLASVVLGASGIFIMWRRARL